MKQTVILALLLLSPLAALAEVWQKPPLGLPPVVAPASNPITPEKIALGEKLYNDTRLSSDQTIGCVSCHMKQKGFADGRPVSLGVGKQAGARNAPSSANAAYNTTQFWDGRAPSLEEQSKGPFTNPIEHGLANADALVTIVKGDPAYVKSFRSVFGVSAKAITIDHIAMAIATFERTLLFGNSPFDRYFFGGDEKAISKKAKLGFELFKGKGRCQTCHSMGGDSALFTNHDFHNLGVGFSKIASKLKRKIKALRRAKKEGTPVDPAVLSSAQASEMGRFAVTLQNQHIGAFKTPTLRNVALTAPYMHDGSVATLEDVIELYDRGGEANPFLDGGMQPLGLTPAEKEALVAFLKSLTSPELH